MIVASMSSRAAARASPPRGRSRTRAAKPAPERGDSACRRCASGRDSRPRRYAGRGRRRARAGRDRRTCRAARHSRAACRSVRRPRRAARSRRCDGRPDRTARTAARSAPSAPARATRISGSSSRDRDDRGGEADLHRQSLLRRRMLLGKGHGASASKTFIRAPRRVKLKIEWVSKSSAILARFGPVTD